MKQSCEDLVTTLRLMAEQQGLNSGVGLVCRCWQCNIQYRRYGDRDI